jgi:hypothetical protein
MSPERNEVDPPNGADDAGRERPSDGMDAASSHGGEGDPNEAGPTGHSCMNEELADLERLRELFLSCGPSLPDEAAWQAVRARIHEQVSDVRPARRRASRPVWSILGLTAAAVLGAVLLTRSWWTGGAIPKPGPEEEPYPVVAAEDVDIISIETHDVAGLVVGEPPVSGELVFVQLEDVHVLHCKRCPISGNGARLEQGEVPMVVAVVAEGGEPEDE